MPKPKPSKKPKTTKTPKTAKAPKSPKSSKKSKKSKSKKTKVIPEIDYADKEHFKPNVVMIYAEFDKQCQIFREQFDRFLKLMQEQFPKTVFQCVVNTTTRLGPDGPRVGAFEISIAQNARCPEELLWTGVKQGPPRRMKFSPTNYEELWPVVKKIVNRVYIAPDEEEEENAVENVEVV